MRIFISAVLVHQADRSHFKKDVSSELETALSIITTAYLRSEDILTSVEENLEYLNPPVKTVFADFVSRIRLIDPDLEAALEELKGKIENDVFMEWVDALKSCLYDRSLKTTLTPIVVKLSDMRIVNAELEYLVFDQKGIYHNGGVGSGEYPAVIFPEPVLVRYAHAYHPRTDYAGSYRRNYFCFHGMRHKTDKAD